MMLKTRDFYFVRHGETDWNREGRGMGQKDVPLNSRGIEQAHAAAQILKQQPIETICFSPLARAKQTAEIIADHIKVPLFEIPDLVECCWGEFEGKIKGQWIADWIGGADIPGAEKHGDFQKRALTGVNQALEHEGHVLIVSHGGVFWAVDHFGHLGTADDLSNGVPIFLRAPLDENTAWSCVSLQ
jgi:broad specificity phosphatase PhoE